jgi:hypothetical protein
MGVVTYVTTEPYAKAVEYAQSFMQRAVQSPAEESKAFATFAPSPSSSSSSSSSAFGGAPSSSTESKYSSGSGSASSDDDGDGHHLLRARRRKPNAPAPVLLPAATESSAFVGGFGGGGGGGGDWPTYNATLLSIATAVPPNSLYKQTEIAEVMKITDPTLKKLFGASHIVSRNLAGLREEQQMDPANITQGYLLNKHMK